MYEEINREASYVVCTVASSIGTRGGRLAGIVYKKGRGNSRMGELAPFVSVVCSSLWVLLARSRLCSLTETTAACCMHLERCERFVCKICIKYRIIQLLMRKLT